MLSIRCVPLIIAAVLIIADVSVSRSARAEASVLQPTPEAPAPDLRRAKILTISGIALTAVGGVTFVSGLGIGGVALHYLGDADTSAIFGYISLSTMSVALPFLAVGVPLLIIGRKRWKRIERTAMFLPTPFIAEGGRGRPEMVYGLKWQLSF